MTEYEKVKAQLAKHEKLEADRIERMEKARETDPFSNAARFRPSSLAWQDKWLRLSARVAELVPRE